MLLIEYILDKFLYEEDIQDLARERGLVISRPKDELISDLITSGRFVPEGAVQYLNARQLPQLCREWRLDHSGPREDLFKRVSDAIWSESDPAGETKKPPRRATGRQPAPGPKGDSRGEQTAYNDIVLGWSKEAPGGTSEHQPQIGPFVKSWTVRDLAEHEAALDKSRDVSRVHPDTTGPWAVAILIAGAVVTGSSVVFISLWGVYIGAIDAVVVAMVAGAILLATSHRWIPVFAGAMRKLPDESGT